MQLLASEQRVAELKSASKEWPSVDLAPSQVCDLELLLSGAFSPLTRFLGRADYESVVSSLRLADGTLWPVPLTLEIPEELALSLHRGDWVALRDPEGVMLAAVKVEEIWQPNSWCLSGSLEGIELPRHYDFRSLRFSPASLREEFERLGWNRVVAFSSNQPMNREDYENTVQAMRDADASLLLHAMIGVPETDKIDPFVLVRCHQAILSRYSAGTAKLAILPSSVRFWGLHGTLLQAIIHKNYGCSYWIAQEAFSEYQEEIGVGIMPFPLGLGGARVPEVERELERSYPAREKQGITVFFTGLSGAGKSTIANILRVKFLERGGRQVSLLDGDLVRKHLSSELGFSAAHRDINIRRIGYVASEITRNGGIAICAPIAPYNHLRREVREMVEAHGRFILVYLATPIEICEGRDVKGLYAKARAGLVGNFTGVSDPYEVPEDAEIILNTNDLSAEESADRIFRYLEAEGYLRINE